MKPIAIFNNGPIRRSERGFYDACGGDHDVLFATACGLPVERMLDIDVEHGDPLPDPAGIAGVILTGSTANITERRPWVEAEAAWVRRNRGSVPMLGVCFGHQLLSHALGGHVDWTPSGPEYGTIDVMGETAASGDPVFTGFPTSITVQSAHCQTVHRLPEGAQVLARGASGIQAARLNDTMWGLQFHPEFTATAMRALFESYPAFFAERKVDTARQIAGLRDTAQAFGFLRNFAAVCASHEPAGTR